jgi:molybdopterin converting factor small subunit
MAITILVPTSLRAFTDRNAEVSVEARNVGQAIGALAGLYPDIQQHLYQSEGEQGSPLLRPCIHVFVGDTDIKKFHGLDTPLIDRDTIMLVPAIAGGL